MMDTNSFEKALANLSEKDFGLLLEEVRAFSDVGPTIDEYMFMAFDMSEVRVDAFSFDNMPSDDSDTISEYCLAA